ncbi:MAG: SDR family NAD(P)-dependent oxidoreductase [Chlamydiales bacterium]
MSDWVLVTGGAKGLGAAIAVALARRGYNIVIHSRKSDPQKVVQDCQKEGIEVGELLGDFSTPKGVEEFLKNYQKKFPSTKGIVNNVGNFQEVSPKEMTDELSRMLMQTNLHAPEALIRSLLPSLIENRGRVVNIGTTGIGQSRPNLSATAYAMTKEALWKYTLSLAKELVPYHVMVNMVSPGVLENSIDVAKHKELPMREPTPLTCVADAVAFLFGSSHITGQNLTVSGGFGL